ncbi:MAG: pilus assembly protein TadB [Planctomycetes bacterium]|nr:pilus assembly protein TadB [Planctomycetota bacterium]
MNDIVRIALVVGLVIALPAIYFLWRRIHLLEQSRARLGEPLEATEDKPPRATPLFQRYHFLPWMVALVVGIGLYAFARFPAIFAASFGLVVGLVLTQLETYRLTYATLQIEEQLADAIDLMVAALRVGAGATSALEIAARETKAPLRAQLEEVLGRIRLGDDAQSVLRDLEARVPLETFRLFCSALSVHWETGGSLAATLAIVGRGIRDRVEVQRRIRALSTQARVSTISVLLVTYFIALIIWRNDPERMSQFLATVIGQYLVAGAIVLQAVGLVWASALSRLRY